MTEREKLIAIIEAENEKPIEQRNIDLIDECLEKFIELNPEEDLTDDELEEGLEKLQEKLKEEDRINSKKPKIKCINFRHLLVAAIVVLALSATIICVGGRSEFYKHLQENRDTLENLEIGETMVVDGRAFVKNKQFDYTSAKKFYKEWKQLDILYPTAFPKGVKLNGINVRNYITPECELMPDEYDITYRMSSNPKHQIYMRTYEKHIESFIGKTGRIETVNGIECHVVPTDSEESFSQCGFIHNGIYYIVTAPNEAELFEIIEGLKPLSECVK